VSFIDSPCAFARNDFGPTFELGHTSDGKR
jgi:hypothetical protein